MKPKTALSGTFQIVAMGLLSWLLTPQSMLPTIVFLALLINVCVDLVRHRTSRFTWIITLAFVFVAAGVVHDATVQNYASALCRDGTYSYSAHRGELDVHYGSVYTRSRRPAERFPFRSVANA